MASFSDSASQMGNIMQQFFAQLQGAHQVWGPSDACGCTWACRCSALKPRVQAAESGNGSGYEGSPAQSGSYNSPGQQHWAIQHAKVRTVASSRTLVDWKAASIAVSNPLYLVLEQKIEIFEASSFTEVLTSKRRSGAFIPADFSFLHLFTRKMDLFYQIYFWQGEREPLNLRWAFEMHFLRCFCKNRRFRSRRSAQNLVACLAKKKKFTTVEFVEKAVLWVQSLQLWEKRITDLPTGDCIG